MSIDFLHNYVTGDGQTRSARSSVSPEDARYFERLNIVGRTATMEVAITNADQGGEVKFDVSLLRQGGERIDLFSGGFSSPYPLRVGPALRIDGPPDNWKDLVRDLIKQINYAILRTNAPGTADAVRSMIARVEKIRGRTA